VSALGGGGGHDDGGAASTFMCAPPIKRNTALLFPDALYQTRQPGRRMQSQKQIALSDQNWRIGNAIRRMRCKERQRERAGH